MVENYQISFIFAGSGYKDWKFKNEVSSKARKQELTKNNTKIDTYYWFSDDYEKLSIAFQGPDAADFLTQSDSILGLAKSVLTESLKGTIDKTNQVTMSLRLILEPLLTEDKSVTKKLTIYIKGHSRGGVIATQFAKEIKPIINKKLYCEIKYFLTTYDPVPGGEKGETGKNSGSVAEWNTLKTGEGRLLKWEDFEEDEINIMHILSLIGRGGAGNYLFTPGDLSIENITPAMIGLVSIVLTLDNHTEVCVTSDRQVKELEGKLPKYTVHKNGSSYTYTVGQSDPMKKMKLREALDGGCVYYASYAERKVEKIESFDTLYNLVRNDISRMSHSGAPIKDVKTFNDLTQKKEFTNPFDNIYRLKLWMGFHTSDGNNKISQRDKKIMEVISKFGVK